MSEESPVSEEPEDPFMARAQELIEAEAYADFLDWWGADASRSDAFKSAAFDGFEPTTDDVIVSTYPKSGTTWTLQIAYQMGYLGNGTFDHMDDVVSWPDKLIPMENPDVGDRSYLDDSPTGLHVIKSHLEAAFVPLNDDARYISVIRDPKDMLVSMIHFENGFNHLLFGATVPTDAFARSFMTDRFMYQNWPEFIDSWWQLRHRDNVLVMLYEEMRERTDETLRMIAEFLDVSLTDAEFALVREKSGFDWMKANGHRFDPPAWDQGPVTLVRSGKTGSAQNDLSPDQRRAIDDWCLAELERIGSDFPYAERYGV